MNKSYSKIRHIQEANITLEKRTFLMKEQSTGDLKSKLKAVKNNYSEVCRVCKNERNIKQSTLSKKAANDFQMAITGGANPFDNFGGFEDKGVDTDAYVSQGQKQGPSPAHNAGNALSQLKTAEELCDMINNYELYTGSGETFEEALSGELKYKVDSSSNLKVMFIDPVSKILGT